MCHAIRAFLKVAGTPVETDCFIDFSCRETQLECQTTSQPTKQSLIKSSWLSNSNTSSNIRFITWPVHGQESYPDKVDLVAGPSLYKSKIEKLIETAKNDARLKSVEYSIFSSFVLCALYFVTSCTFTPDDYSNLWSLWKQHFFLLSTSPLDKIHSCTVCKSMVPGPCHTSTHMCQNIFVRTILFRLVWRTSVSRIILDFWWTIVLYWRDRTSASWNILGLWWCYTMELTQNVDWSICLYVPNVHKRSNISLYKRDTCV